MRRSLTLVALWVAIHSVTFGQSVHPSSVHTAEPRPINGAEARKILAVISALAADFTPEADCSHLVHDVYEKAGFSYDYASSRDLYIGSTNFTRVHGPQAGDLIVWRGHVGIVIDPKEHTFFSSVRSGPDTQFYDSPYWRSRGIARFYRYMTDEPFRPAATVEAARHRSKVPTVDGPRAADPAAGVSAAPREIVLQVAGKTPVADEIRATFTKMGDDVGKALRFGGLNSVDQPIIVYRDVRFPGCILPASAGRHLRELKPSLLATRKPALSLTGRSSLWNWQRPKGVGS
jgi:hypothetical protein